MNRRPSISRFCRSPFPRRAAVTLVVLAYSSLAFGGAIHDAASAGDLEKVKALLKANPNLVFSKDTNGLTPLHFAAANGHKDVAELLLANKAEVDAKSNAKTTRGGTPLHLAAMNGREDVAALLLASKADANAKDNDGETPLHRVAVQGHKDVAALLLANKADVNARERNGLTPLHLAAEFGSKDVVVLLLANKADVNASDHKGRTALDWAKGHKEVMAVLLQAITAAKDTR